MLKGSQGAAGAVPTGLNNSPPPSAGGAAGAAGGGPLNSSPSQQQVPVGPPSLAGVASSTAGLPRLAAQTQGHLGFSRPTSAVSAASSPAAFNSPGGAQGVVSPGASPGEGAPGAGVVSPNGVGGERVTWTPGGALAPTGTRQRPMSAMPLGLGAPTRGGAAASAPRQSWRPEDFRVVSPPGGGMAAGPALSRVGSAGGPLGTQASSTNLAWGEEPPLGAGLGGRSISPNVGGANGQLPQQQRVFPADPVPGQGQGQGQRPRALSPARMTLLEGDHIYPANHKQMEAWGAWEPPVVRACCSSGLFVSSASPCVGLCCEFWLCVTGWGSCPSLSMGRARWRIAPEIAGTPLFPQGPDGKVPAWLNYLFQRLDFLEERVGEAMGRCIQGLCGA